MFVTLQNARSEIFESALEHRQLGLVAMFAVPLKTGAELGYWFDCKRRELRDMY